MVLVIVGHLGEATRRQVDERRGTDSGSVLDRLAALGLIEWRTDLVSAGRPNAYRLTTRALTVLGHSTLESFQAWCRLQVDTDLQDGAAPEPATSTGPATTAGSASTARSAASGSSDRTTTAASRSSLAPPPADLAVILRSGVEIALYDAMAAASASGRGRAGSTTHARLRTAIQREARLNDRPEACRAHFTGLLHRALRTVRRRSDSRRQR